MRTVRCIFILLALFLAIPSPVLAAGSSHTVFMPLVVNADSPAALVAQSHQAFEALLPDLLAAQQRGELVSFQPSYSFGVLLIEKAVSVEVSAPVAGRAVYGTLSEATAAIRGLSFQAEGGGPVNLFDFDLYGTCFSGRNIQPGARVFVKLMSQSDVIAKVNQLVAEDGSMLACFNVKYPDGVRPGRKITIKIFLPGSATPSYSYLSNVPNLTIGRIDKSAATFYGSGSRKNFIEGTLYHPELDQINAVRSILRSSYVSDTGKWKLAFNYPLPNDADAPAEGGGYGIESARGGDFLHVTLHQTPNVHFSRFATVPVISCSLGASNCTYSGIAGQSVALVVTHAGQMYRFNQTASLFVGSIVFKLADSAGRPIILALDDKVAATAAAPLTLPAITALVDYDNDLIYGSAPASRWLDVTISSPDLTTGCWTQSGESKQYTCDLSGTVDLTPDDFYKGHVKYTNPITGNVTLYSWKSK